MKPDYATSLAFLEKLQPEDGWTLTSISINKQYINTRRFEKEQGAELMKWLEEENSSNNIYYALNPSRNPQAKKFKKEDVLEVRYFHVDLDPRVGESVEDALPRLMGLVENSTRVPRPHFMVYSGGGYNAIWRLEKPLPLEGPGDIGEAERYTKWIELEFEGDHCYNIDRILRLPGTINYPDAGKRKKGRVKVVADVVWAEDGAVSYDDFEQATQVQDSQGFQGRNVQIESGNVIRLGDVDELPEEVPPWCKVVIVQGLDPDNPNKHESRSEWLFAVCCELVRCKVPDETIFSILTDKDFAISASVLDNRNPEKYAIRQIGRAKDKAISPDLERMNEAHAVIEDMGGKCRVISEVWDPGLKRNRVSFVTFNEFRNRYLHKKVPIGFNRQGETTYQKLGSWWLEHESRRQYGTVVFAPGKDVPGAFNLWKGFGVMPKAGDCSLFLEHIHDVLCSGEQALTDYLIGWLANTVQNPDEPGHAAVVLHGGQGTGKSFFAKAFGRLFDRHFLQVSNPKYLVGSFNAHLRDCVVLFGDEAFYAGDKKHESVLKTLVTEDMITIEAKGVDVEAAPNCVHLIMASNEDWVVPVGFDDRRFFVLDVNDSRQGDRDYFDAMALQLEDGGYEALLDFLLRYDLKGFDVRKPPKTKALQRQKVYSMSVEEQWWKSKLDDGLILETHTKWEPVVSACELLASMVQTQRRLPKSRRSGETQLGGVLKKLVPRMEKFQGSEEICVTDYSNVVRRLARPTYYRFPPLSLCRKAWEDRYGETEWEEFTPMTDADKKALADAKGDTPF